MLDYRIRGHHTHHSLAERVARPELGKGGWNTKTENGTEQQRRGFHMAFQPGEF
jgi:hypothetical protein